MEIDFQLLRRKMLVTIAHFLRNFCSKIAQLLPGSETLNDKITRQNKAANPMPETVSFE